MSRYLWITVFCAVLSLGIFWTPFWLNTSSVWGINITEPSLKTIVANYDGMNFLVVERSWYNPEVIARDYSTLVGERGERYFAAHYPVYAALIWFFDLFSSGDNAILLSIVASNIMLAGALYVFFVAITKNYKWAMVASLIALFWPARMLSVRAVGSNEPIFIAFTLFSLLASIKNRHFLAGLAGALAVLTRSPGILLFFAYVLTIATNRVSWRDKVQTMLPYLMMPASLLLLWGYYGITYGDPLAYFKVGGNINLSLPPFLVFGSNNDWVSGAWLEDIVFNYAFYLGGIILLYEKYRNISNYKSIANYGLIYLIATFFIVHRDIARYSLPLIPLALLGYLPKQIIERKWLPLLLLLIPIYLVGWNFVVNNMAPIADWTPFL